MQHHFSFSYLGFGFYCMCLTSRNVTKWWDILGVELVISLRQYPYNLTTAFCRTVWGGLLPLKQDWLTTVKDPHSIFHSRDRKKKKNTVWRRIWWFNSQYLSTIHMSLRPGCILHMTVRLPWCIHFPLQEKKEKKNLSTTTAKLYLHEFTNCKKGLNSE